ncbi:MAG: PhzF family phenazine biosynthesis protein [Candidatus Berkiella sp.]
MNTIWIVDAFAHGPYTGNPAAVMIVDEFPKDMQQIAAEMNLSETVFVKKIATNHFHIRWLTPIVEVKLCGHATLAASHILFQEKLINSNTIKFESLSGPLEVTQRKDGLTLNFPLQPVSKQLDIASFEELLDLKDVVIDVVQAHDDVIVLLKNEQQVAEFIPNIEKIKEIDARAVVITAASSQYDFVSRFFGPRVGVNEDPVTGAAHCKLADFWAKRLKKNQFTAYQASKRGGVLQVEIQNDRVLLTGKAITVMAGTWLI